MQIKLYFLCKNIIYYTILLLQNNKFLDVSQRAPNNIISITGWLFWLFGIWFVFVYANVFYTFIFSRKNLHTVCLLDKGVRQSSINNRCLRNIFKFRGHRKPSSAVMSWFYKPCTIANQINLVNARSLIWWYKI